MTQDRVLDYDWVGPLWSPLVYRIFLLNVNSKGFAAVGDSMADAIQNLEAELWARSLPTA